MGQLSPALRKRIDTAADSAATLHLAAEEAARRLTTRTIEETTERLVARVAVDLGSKEDAWRRAASAIREFQEQLQDDFTRAMLEARSIGREFAARQVALEAEPLIVTQGYGLAAQATLPAAEVEALWAHQAASGMARKFGSAAIAETQAWKNGKQGAEALPRRLARVAQSVEPERKLHTVTQMTGVVAEAKRERWIQLKEQGGGGTVLAPGPTKTRGGRRGGGGPLKNARWLWSAILDGKTCPVCWRLDGTMVEVGKPFPEDAKLPLHAHDRCDVVTVFFPAEYEHILEDLGSDYEALKADVKDYMGERKFNVGTGVRHAKSFVDDVFKARNLNQPKGPIAGSPLVLTRRLNDRALYFPNLERPKAPSLRW